MRKLIAVCCALLLAVGVGAAWYVQAPSDAALREMAWERPVTTRPAAELWGSPSLLAEMVKSQEAQGREVGFLLGSSELGQTAEDSAHPVRFFAENNMGFDLVSLGAGGYQSLWATIETAALDECGALSGKKIAFLVGDQWFMSKEGCTSEAFLNSFSEEAFRECMENSSLTEETREQIRARVEALGVDAQMVEYLADSSIVAKVNRTVAGVGTDGDRRSLLAEALEANAPFEEKGNGGAALDWDLLMERAEQEGAAACTNNPYGIYDDYFDTYVSDKPWGQPYEGEPFSDWSEVEFSDLKLFLDVCKELGITPFLVIEPMNGEYYDIQPYTKESREEFYDELRTVLDEADVEYLDLSSHDYDKYYLRDVMHAGWKSWVEIDRALCEFYGADTSSTVGGTVNADGRGETTAEQDADAAAEEMLEVEGAGKEVMEDREGGR